MAMSRAIVLVLLVGVASAAQMSLNQATAKTGQAAAGKPTLMSIARQVFADREGAAERQAVEQDSYLEALEYSQNSAALQGEGGGIGGFFRYASNLVSRTFRAFLFHSNLSSVNVAPSRTPSPTSASAVLALLLPSPSPWSPSVVWPC